MEINRVFSEYERNDIKYAQYSEPMFSFLDRSALPIADRVRNLIEDWYFHYPLDAQRELLPRLQSKDDEEFVSGFFELYLYELLIRMGYTVEIHPKKADEDKKPDFLVRGFEEEFYLEAAITNEETLNEVRGRTLLNIALDKVNEIESPDFFAHIVIEGNATSPIASKSLKNQILEWFKTLDHGQLVPVYHSGGLEAMPNKVFEFEGVSLKVVPIPKNLHKGKIERIIGSQMYGVRMANTKEAIRKAIKRKTSRYGVLEKPYIVAVNVLPTGCDREDVMDALFGSEQYTFNIDALDEPPRPSRAKDGAWAKNKGTRVSGVLIVCRISPWNVANQSLTLYLNPWAKYPYKAALLKLPYAEPRDDGKMHWIDGIHPRAIFGLQDRWPE